MLDLAIIGGGPAALAAAIYAARAGLEVRIFEKGRFGGVLPELSNIENYPGFSGPGAELATKLSNQAAQAGAKLEYGECTAVRETATGFELMVDEAPVLARAVLVASGSEPRRLDFDLQIPVSYCALCDGALAKGKRVVVVGGANSAVQEALYLAGLAREVTIVTHSQLKADQELLERLARATNITVVEGLEPTVEYLEQFDYCFVYIGKTPATGFLPKEILDESEYVKTDTETGIFLHQTAIKGVFAAGDVRQDSVKQIITAAGDGAAAAIEITEWLRA